MSLPYALARKPLSADAAARTLAEAGIMQAEEFYALADELRQVAFTLVRVRNAAVLARCRQALERVILDGGNMEDFAAWLEADGQAWERWYTELVYRNAVQQGYSRARWIAVNQPHIKQAFPAIMYDAILDGRETELCHNLDGKWWRREAFPPSLWPPNHHQCRSVARPLTIDRAESMPDREVVGNADTDGPADGWGGDPSASWQQAADRRASILERFLTRP